MKARFVVLIAVVALCAGTVIAQKKNKVFQGKVCGDPTAACKARENFQPFDLPFDTGKDLVMFESVPFYGIVLKSVKLQDWGDCQNPSFPEAERLPLQELFPHNKVFAQNCLETGMNYYEGVADKTAFIGVYAGRTLAEANKFLKAVKATGKFEGVRVRKMKIGINGT